MSKYVGWLALAVLFLALNFAAVGTERWQFLYGILYAVNFFALAFLMYFDKPNFATSLMISLMGFFMVLTSNGWLSATVGLGVSVALFAGAVIARFVLKASESFLSKAVSSMPFFMLVLYYFGGLALNLMTPTGQFVSVGSIPWVWMFTRLGILVLAADGLAKLSGKTRGSWKLLMPIGLLLAFVGALYLTVGLHAGLSWLSFI